MPRDLPPGIYRTSTGYRAVVNIAAGRKQKRFPPATSMKEMKRWRNQMIVKLETLYPHKRAGAVQRGTFSADAKRYLDHLSIASWDSRRSELRAWETRVGKVRRSAVTQDHVRAAIKAWTEAGVPPKTIVNRLRALSAMYHALDGPKAWVPSEDVQTPKVPRRQPRAMSLEILRAVEQQLRTGDPKTHARYMVLVSTGARPVHLKRADPKDVDLAGRVWFAHAAKGGHPIALPLNDDMVAAWQAFIAAEAWGDFNSTEYAKALRAAGWPEDVRPYNAKHTFGMALGEAGVDMRVIADWFGQTKTDTARIYVPVLQSRLKDASDRMNGRLGWASGNTASAPVLPANVAALSHKDKIALFRKMLEDAIAAL